MFVALAALGTQPWQDFAGQQEAGLATILDNVTRGSWASTILAAGAVISIFPPPWCTGRRGSSS